MDDNFNPYQALKTFQPTAKPNAEKRKRISVEEALVGLILGGITFVAILFLTINGMLFSCLIARSSWIWIFSASLSVLFSALAGGFATTDYLLNRMCDVDENTLDLSVPAGPLKSKNKTSTKFGNLLLVFGSGFLTLMLLGPVAMGLTLLLCGSFQMSELVTTTLVECVFAASLCPSVFVSRWCWNRAVKKRNGATADPRSKL